MHLNATVLSNMPVYLIDDFEAGLLANEMTGSWKCTDMVCH